MVETPFNAGPFIVDAKKSLCKHNDVAKHFSRIKDEMCKQVDEIARKQANQTAIVPEVSYASIHNNKISKQAIESIRKHGCVIVRNVFDRQLAEDWNLELGHYLEHNNYYDNAKAKANPDDYFGDLKDARPQIFGIYWSRPQVMARQAESMACTKRFLNNLWDINAPSGPEFDPNHDYAYADRTRRRSPGDTTLGLSPHIDTGSYERWVDPAFQKIYTNIFNGRFDQYSPWRAAHRTQTREYASPAVASMFRTFQGWTALTEQGPGDGTLELLPVSNSIAYVLLRALQDDVPENELCLANPGRALKVDSQWHPDVMPGIVPIQTVSPGDTVWWHPDIIHGVGDEHSGQDYSNVIYIGASPVCSKNKAYALRQARYFEDGRSAPDFAAQDFETNFDGRASVADLTDLGKRQMALA